MTPGKRAHTLSHTHLSRKGPTMTVLLTRQELAKSLGVALPTTSTGGSPTPSTTSRDPFGSGKRRSASGRTRWTNGCALLSAQGQRKPNPKEGDDPHEQYIEAGLDRTC